MVEKPILFPSPMVRAILDGRKTMTRRALKPQPIGLSYPVRPEHRAGQNWVFMNRTDEPGYQWAGDDFKTKYAAGDQLWVREAFSGPWGCRNLPPSSWPETCQIWYWADGNPEDGDWTKPKPSIHMPRWASRILLKVTAVKIERLQDISEEDAKAEGVEPRIDHVGDAHCLYTMPFNILWTTINGPGSWEANPWVAAYTFERVTP